MAYKFVQFTETYLNNLHKETIKQLDENDLNCYKCGQPFKRGQWFVRKIRNNGHGTKRHIRCAIQAGVINYTQGKKYLNLFYVLGLVAWCMLISQYYMLGHL